MDQATFYAALTRETACPACDERRLEFLLRCDLEFGACLHTAHCRACDESFEIVTGGPAPPAAGVYEDAVEPCPTCGGHRRRATLHCSLETHACVYTLDCPVCASER